MQQMALKNKSKWFPYLNILPKSLILPHMFTKEEFIMIQDDQIALIAKKRHKRMKKRYNSLKKRIQQLFEGTL